MSQDPFHGHPEGAVSHDAGAPVVDRDPQAPMVQGDGYVSPGEFLARIAGDVIVLAPKDSANALISPDEGEVSEAADRTQEVFALRRNPFNYYEIDIDSDVKAEDLRGEVSEEAWELMEEEVDGLAAELDGAPVVMLSSTFEGGGVAMQIPPEINFLRQRGINVYWLVAERDDEAFAVTKKMHNGQQDVARPGAEPEDFTEADAAKHVEFGMKNFEGMKERVPYFGDAAIYVFHDPQLVGMLPAVKELNPDARIIYRNHIHTDRDKMAQEGSLQNRIMRHIHEICGVNGVDTYVAHPVDSFVPYGTANVAHQPPVSSLQEELNQELSPERVAEKLDSVDRQIARQNRRQQARNARLLGEDSAHVDDQGPLDRGRDWITGFARFDWAKAQMLNMELQKRVIDQLAAAGVPESEYPLSVIAANGATDDLDRETVMNYLLEQRRTTYGAYQDYIRIIGLEHDYEIPNALQSSSLFTVNFSIAEGWEHRRAESMLKGVPSISSDAGGLPMQGRDGQGGLVANLGDLHNELDRIAAEVAGDIVDPERHQERTQTTLDWAEGFIRPELTTVPNVIRDARIMRGHGDMTWRISDLVEQRAARRKRDMAPDIGRLAA
jgi:alpha,alpha-trehalose phosphorylase (configuration-retaining)